MNEQAFKNLVSGRTAGPLASVARAGLFLLSAVYRIVIAFRNGLFDFGIRTPKRAPVAVISVGNLTTGGTGKTPIVALIVQSLQRQGCTPGIISRGYRSVDGQANDEKKVLERLCPGVAHEQNVSRFHAAANIAAANDVDVLVMDDGFQHRQLHRALDIVLVDATNPFGYESLLPRGLLREPLTSFRRADAVIITRADMVPAERLAEIRQQITASGLQPGHRIWMVEFRPTGLLSGTGHRSALHTVQSRPVMLFSGIGNPEAFSATCRQAGMQIKETLWFPDHHHYSETDQQTIHQKSSKSGAEVRITTLKDLVKLPATDDILALEIAAVFTTPADEAELEKMLKNAVSPSADAGCDK